MLTLDTLFTFPASQWTDSIFKKAHPSTKHLNYDVDELYGYFQRCKL